MSTDFIENSIDDWNSLTPFGFEYLINGQFELVHV